MSFVRHQDTIAKRSSRTLKYFNGNHFGFSPIDQPDDVAYQSDFNCWQHRLELRAGFRKNESTGYAHDLDYIFDTNVMPVGMIGVIGGGNLTVYPTSDLDDGLNKFYSWDDVRKQFTWDKLKQKKWRDLVTGRG